MLQNDKNYCLETVPNCDFFSYFLKEKDNNLNALLAQTNKNKTLTDLLFYNV